MEISRFPNKLRSFRRCCGYSQKKVARLLGLADTSSLSRWEHGVAIPGTIQVFRLARMYRTQPNNLYDEVWQQIESEFSLLAQDELAINNNQTFYA